MSGTSLDGVDTVTARLERVGGALRWEVIARAAHVYPDALAARLHAALKPESSDVILLTELHQEVGLFYAEVVAAAQARDRVDLVALSGQTVYHIPRVEPERGWHVKSTLQLGEATVVTERCRVTTVSDFRQSDFSAGGQGAPLVSFPDSVLYAAPGVSRAVINLGGIANVTYLPASGDPDGVLAFDTGPATCLLNEAAARFAGEPFDRDGRLALAGTVDGLALERLLADPYFALRPPKTTGREHFHLDAALARGWPDGAPDLPDLMATLAELTVRTVADGLADHLTPLGVDEVLVAGGGARNPALLEGLRRAMSAPVRGFAELGFDDKDRETLAMAVMGYFCVHGEPNVLPSATGARWPVVAGKVSRPWSGRTG
ncbi:MAG: anhydro-N-acetylmuramic acid kinase [Trueperaceae bacterium]|jgi:anhydro-N-acetylmuramic acid kinase|nr:anhydro-N-acetylmuramic acid kinase [Trueperaceae bacterium]